MSLNTAKFELICFKQTVRNPNLILLEELPFKDVFNQYSTGNDLHITPTNCVKDLGILINHNLEWDSHISKICKTAKQLTAWILNVFYTRNKFVMITLFNSLVRSRLEYCCQVWDPCKIKHIDAIEQVQRSFTSKIENMDEEDTYWDRLTKLGIMSLQRRREKLCIIFTWKIKNNVVPNVINLDFSWNPRKSITTATVKPMPRVRGKLLSSYENSFAIKSARLWNKLPPKLGEITKLSSFRRELDKYLSLFPDCPPVKGYFHVNTNSILDYNNKTSQYVLE